MRAIVFRIAADIDPDNSEPIPVLHLDALPWAVRWMCAGVTEASGMVVALTSAASAEPLFKALEVRALAAERRTRARRQVQKRRRRAGGGGLAAPLD